MTLESNGKGKPIITSEAEDKVRSGVGPESSNNSRSVVAKLRAGLPGGGGGGVLQNVTS